MRAWPFLSLHHKPSFSVSTHCIVIFFTKLVLLVMVCNFLRRKGLRELEKRQPKYRKYLQTIVEILSVWIPTRIICPGVLLRVGRWTCAWSEAALTPSMDIFNRIASSNHFWTGFAWTEVILYAGLLYMFYVYLEKAKYVYEKLRVFGNKHIPGFAAKVKKFRKSRSRNSKRGRTRTVSDSSIDSIEIPSSHAERIRPEDHVDSLINRSVVGKRYRTVYDEV